MKKHCTAVFICLLLLLLIGCSSTPSGTDTIKELQKNGASKIGQNVVVVGVSETKVNQSKMFKVYKGGDFIWATVPEGRDDPPQGLTVRVSGQLQQKEISLVGKVFYIETTEIKFE
jgi:hypothetical protein